MDPRRPSGAGRYCSAWAAPASERRWWLQDQAGPAAARTWAGRSPSAAAGGRRPWRAAGPAAANSRPTEGPSAQCGRQPAAAAAVAGAGGLQRTGRRQPVVAAAACVVVAAVDAAEAALGSLAGLGVLLAAVQRVRHWMEPALAAGRQVVGFRRNQPEVAAEELAEELEQARRSREGLTLALVLERELEQYIGQSRMELMRT